MFNLVITAHGYQNIEVFKHRRGTRSGALEFKGQEYRYSRS